MLCGLLRYSKDCQLDPPNFLNRQDVRFKKLHGTCDTVFRSLREAGVGTVKRSAQTFQSDDEDKLWESNVFNTSTAEGLQNTVFFYVGKVCCLRGGQEQRELKISQFERFNNPERYVYSEHGSKNRNGGFYQLDIENKNVEIYKNTTDSKRCLVSLLDLYFSKLPQSAKDKDIFYCRPLNKYTADGPWYSEQPRGKHFLSDMVKKMCISAGIEGKFTNHT